jgi:hypothetical protein
VLAAPGRSGAGTLQDRWRRVSRLSKAGVPSVVTLGFESDDLETAALLLDARDRPGTEQAQAALKSNRAA